MRALLLFPLLLLATACPTTPAGAPCGATPADEGSMAFREQTAARDGPRDLRLRFVLNSANGERFTASPALETNLGEVLDAQAQGGSLDVQVLLGSTNAVNGEIILTGSLSGAFVDDLDHCPYRQRFLISQMDTSSPVTVLGAAGL